MVMEIKACVVWHIQYMITWQACVITEPFDIRINNLLHHTQKEIVPVEKISASRKGK